MIGPIISANWSFFFHSWALYMDNNIFSNPLVIAFEPFFISPRAAARDRSESAKLKFMSTVLDEFLFRTPPGPHVLQTFSPAGVGMAWPIFIFTASCTIRYFMSKVKFWLSEFCLFAFSFIFCYSSISLAPEWQRHMEPSLATWCHVKVWENSGQGWGWGAGGWN